jgi:hypothetical protein
MFVDFGSYLLSIPFLPFFLKIDNLCGHCCPRSSEFKDLGKELITLAKHQRHVKRASIVPEQESRQKH